MRQLRFVARRIKRTGRHLRWLAPASITVVSVLAGILLPSSVAGVSISQDMRRNTPEPRRPDSDGGWRLVEELRMGRVEGSGPDVFGNLIDVTVDGNGNLYVLDFGSEDVRVFDREGRFQRRVARGGRGPGETVYLAYGMMSVVWQPPNRLWVDQGNGRLVVDSLGNELANTPAKLLFYVEGRIRTLSTIFAADAEYVYEEVTGWARRTSYDMEYPRLTHVARQPVSAAHEILPGDTLFIEARKVTMAEPESGGTRGGRGTMTVMRPARTEPPQFVWAVGPTGNLWLAHRSEHRFHEVTFEGDTIRTFEPSRLPSVAGEVEDGAAFRSVIAALEVSPDGWLWARRQQPAEQADADSVWDLFDNCGRYRGAVAVPGPLIALTLGPAGEVHVIVSDALDVDYVLRLRLRGADGASATAEGCPV